MKLPWSHRGSAPAQGLWLGPILVLAAVLLPTACVLWFMLAAVHNERLAIRQRLVEIYQEQIDQQPGRADEYWAGVHAAMKHAAGLPAGAAFAELIEQQTVQSALIYRDGKLAYPTLDFSSSSAAATAPPHEWEQAEALAAAGKSLEAAALYQRSTTAQPSADLRARALQAAARLFLQGGNRKTAVQILAVDLQRDEYLDARGTQGNLIAPDAALLAITLLDTDASVAAKSPSPASGGGRGWRVLTPGEGVEVRTAPDSRGTQETNVESHRSATPSPGRSTGHPLPLPGEGEGQISSRALTAALATRLRDYAGPPMLSAQRIFLMEQLTSRGQHFPTLAGEQLALSTAEHLESGAVLPELGGDSFLRVPGMDRAWALPEVIGGAAEKTNAARDTVVGLWTQDDLESRLRSQVVKLHGSGISFVLLTKDWGDVPKDVLRIVPLGRFMPDWLLAVTWGAADVHDPLSIAAGHQQGIYLWTGTLSIAAIALLGIAMSVHLRRQARLTALKNDLIATVSHELKTPLSSMRVLVDTLLAGRCKTQEQEKEYLALIARENTRLSRLIDNFLTFSRMERNKRSFTFTAVDVNQVVRDAVDALGDRGRQIQMETASGLPTIQADHDALVTLMLNLLDNACKYSPESSPIRIRTFAGDHDVAIAVKDHGTGIARRHQSRIFERFFQVDQTLARQAGGCGLGLSIVRFILDAHGGTIVVESELGRGSTFTVRLPLHLDC